MVERYARDKMKRVWSVDAKYQNWLSVEKAAVKAWNKLGVIDDTDCQKIVEKAKFDLAQIEEIEQKTKHDVIAFLTSVESSLGDEGRWLHYGLTSSDCIDTATAIQIKEAINIIIDGLKDFLDILKSRSFEFKNTLMVGRSHGIHGEPITLGLVFTLWHEEMKRHLAELKSSLDVISVGKVSGSMGNFAHFPLELEELVCKELELKPALISSQIIQRDRYAKVMSSLALLASSCEKIAVSIRHYQRTEVYEAEEFFDEGQKGSSSMPHKRNPVLTENITGLCRIIRAYLMPALENVALWHERDISHSSVERFMLPDSFITADFMLHRLSSVVKKLLVYPENMIRNIELTQGLVFSQRVLLDIVKSGISRQEAYKIVQRNAMRVWEDIRQGDFVVIKTSKPLFLQYLLQDRDLTSIIDKDSIEKLFDYGYYTKNIDLIFKRVFG